MSQQAPKRFYLIDGHAQIFRAYHAIRGGMSSPVTGEPTHATFGFVGMLLKLFREQKPDYVAVAVDVSGDKETFRSELYPEYKANREAPPEDFAPQVERIVELCGMMNIPVIGVEGFEADDVIATICDQLAGRDDVLTHIVSRDKDLQQLLSDRVVMFDIHKDETIDVESLINEKGVTPAQVLDMLALMGDSVDNIPGVPGIGPKTAAKLIAKYGSIDELLDHTDELTPKQRENVEATRDKLPLNRKLVALVRDVPTGFELEQAAAQTPDAAVLAPVFKQLGFNRHLRDLDELSAGQAGSEASPSEAEGPDQIGAPLEAGLFAGLDDAPAPASAFDTARADDYAAITTAEQLDEVIAALRDAPFIAVDTETDSVLAMQTTLCGISLAWPSPGLSAAKPGGPPGTLTTQRGVYIPVRSLQPTDHLDTATVLDALRPILEDASIPKVGQNLKYDLLVLRRAGVELRGVTTGFDTMVAAFCLDATRSSFKLDNLALAHLNYEMIPISRLIGTGKKQVTFDRVPLDIATTYAAEDADVTLRLKEVFEPELKRTGLIGLFTDLEMPLVPVLAELEHNGIAVDSGELDTQREALQGRIDELRTTIIDTAKSDFNPDSPKQLATVLFSELGCKPYKKTKTGHSTDSEVLQRIVDEQAGPGGQVAELVLEYRQLTKLVGTYLVALKEAIHPETGRIHASFHQTGAATGRLSSSDPNLQNIPIRTEVGRQIRRAFVAPEGRVLLAADYSQIELRVLAHLSRDPGLIGAFEKDLDIHRAVAAEVFDVPLDEVTDAQRGSAKMVNFGIVYGITPYGLARRLDPSAAASDNVDEAKRIIASYKRRYPKIDALLERCAGAAETKGYVETLMKRRRAIPQIASRNHNVVQLGRRMAINSVVQGSAADLIKLAMIRVSKLIAESQPDWKMLLQIHDELVFEVPEADAEPAAEIIRGEMENAMQLAVPLKVDPSWGRSWYDTK